MFGRLTELPQFLIHFLIQFQDPAGIGDDNLSSFRRDHFPGRTDKEHGPQRSFQIFDGDAEGRLGNEQLLGSSMVIPRIRQCAEIVQLFKIQVHDASPQILFFLICTYYNICSLEISWILIMIDKIYQNVKEYNWNE